ncbi:hypothetical protein BC834DRAFT_967964 [Gloeopeniophorella convolvens]|nr:hypothetical protein BC834DRAFT_967964 [Gloeopeniophorella convolvens]
MSELDADLYGDLYGNDDFSLDPTIKATKAEPEELSPAPDTSAPAPALELEENSSAVTPTKLAPPTVPPPAPIASWSEPASSAPRSAQPPPPPPPASSLQQIPTYQESHSDDRDASRGNYHSAIIDERSVRPSEMKDEGIFCGCVTVGGLVA